MQLYLCVFFCQLAFVGPEKHGHDVTEAAQTEKSDLRLNNDLICWRSDVNPVLVPRRPEHKPTPFGKAASRRLSHSQNFVLFSPINIATIIEKTLRDSLRVNSFLLCSLIVQPTSRRLRPPNIKSVRLQIPNTDE